MHKCKTYEITVNECKDPKYAQVSQRLPKKCLLYRYFNSSLFGAFFISWGTSLQKPATWIQTIDDIIQ